MARKKLVLILILVSFLFLVIQLLSADIFSINPQVPKAQVSPGKDGTDLRVSVRDVLTVCKNVGIQCVLGDINWLRKYAASRHNDLQSHDEDCNYLCADNFMSFLIQGDSLKNGKFEYLIRELIKVRFEVKRDAREDERELSVAKRKTSSFLVYHLYLRKSNHFFLMTFHYERLGLSWSNFCDVSTLDDEKQIKTISSSIFCTHQRLIPTFKISSIHIDGLDVHIPKAIFSFIESVKNGIYTPCPLQHARQFYSKYGYKSDPISEKFRSKAKNLLSIAIDVLGQLGIPFWLSSGTCLGWFRQCDVIPHSKDVDIGIWIKYYKKDLIKAFLDNGLKLKHQFGKVGDSFELSFTLNDLKLDIFFFYEEENIMWNGGTQARTGKKFKYIFPKFSLCWSHLLDLTIRVPCPTKPYVLANYGQDWNKLVEKWDWKASPPNVRANGEWPVEERKQVIQVY